MLFDTDILIWSERGNARAIGLIGDAEIRYISILSYMELLQGARNKSEIKIIKNFLSEGYFQTLPLTENIGHRALIYIEEYAQSHGLRSADSIIAATAVENNLALVTSNQRHFKPIHELNLYPFHPSA